MNEFLLTLSQEYIEFPNIGLRLDGVTRSFSLFGREFYWYGMIICAGMLLCILLGLRFSKKYALSQNDLLDYVLIAVPSAIVGARLYYVLFTLDFYKENPSEIWKIWHGGLAIYGGIIGAAIAILITAKVKKQSFLHVMDFALPYIMLGQAIGRWGNFLNQEAYGSRTDWLLGMTGSTIAQEMGKDVLVHPTFLYESLWCLAGYVFLEIYRRKLQKSVGEVTALYMILYGLERALVEQLRTDSLTVDVGGVSIRVSQVLSVVLFVVGICLWIDSRKKGLSLAALKEGRTEFAAAEPQEQQPEETEHSSLLDVVNELDRLEAEENSEPAAAKEVPEVTAEIAEEIAETAEETAETLTEEAEPDGKE